MTSIWIQQVTKRFGATVALDRVELQIQPGELFFLLGPSGGGKTTLLRCLAGFHQPDSGQLWFGDRNVTRDPPYQRNIGMMFQNFALWPHRTVAENVAFGLEERRIGRDEIRRRVEEALASVHMAGLGGRRPAELSGGQQQRVALARALVIRPRCLLLDEPLSNLDARLREEMRAEILRVCRDFKLTTLYVTHDQREALSMSDRVAMLERGRILQIGTPSDLYRRPRSTRVAAFVGDTDMIPGTVIRSDASTSVLVDTAAGRFEGVAGDPATIPQAGSKVTLSIRPECWCLQRERPTRNAVAGRLGETIYLGNSAQHEFNSGDLRLRIVEMNPRRPVAAAERDMFVTASPDDVVVLVE
ncbi:MAG TPA: ABC transporter ATP-binding protein [Opitutaceae bacterium]|nr:ABC transporter ATP-binding protein [Opitutaceae bacterium]